MMQQQPTEHRFTVTWTNPVTKVERRLGFATIWGAKEYVAGRRRKYGGFSGYQDPKVERRDG